MPATPTFPRPPRWWARAVIAASVAVLPKSVRPRYRSEFIADLYGMSCREQAGYTGHVLAGCVPLRLAVRSASHASALEGIDMTARQLRPLRCRLNVRHDWHYESAEDGSRYQRCRRCGKDAIGPVVTSRADLAAQAANFWGIGAGGG